jgi:hypothetical protein
VCIIFHQQNKPKKLEISLFFSSHPHRIGLLWPPMAFFPTPSLDALETALDVRGFRTDDIIDLVKRVWQPKMSKLQFRMSDTQVDCKANRILNVELAKHGFIVSTTIGGEMPLTDALVTVQKALPRESTTAGK